MAGLTDLARRVKSLREGAGLSQQALATSAGLSLSVVTQIEQGVKADPRVSTILALAKALGVSVEHLTGSDKGDKNPASAREARPEPPPSRKKRAKGKEGKL